MKHFQNISDIPKEEFKSVHKVDPEIYFFLVPFFRKSF